MHIVPHIVVFMCVGKDIVSYVHISSWFFVTLGQNSRIISISSGSPVTFNHNLAHGRFDV